MKANGIKALDYQHEDSHLVLILAETSMGVIISTDMSVVNITTDAGDMVDTFVGFSVERITYEAKDATYYTSLVQTADDATVKALEKLNAALTKELNTTQARLDAAIQSNQMLEDCLVEMAEIVYA